MEGIVECRTCGVIRHLSRLYSFEINKSRACNYVQHEDDCCRTDHSHYTLFRIFLISWTDGSDPKQKRQL